MDFHELEAFVSLSRQLHFARAAAAVHTSPSGLSRLLSRLEEELGVRLFERDTRKVELTAEGETFLSFALESLHQREDLRLRLTAGGGKLRGLLRVYASVTACYSILPPFAAALAAEHPELRLSVETGDPAGAEDHVRDGRAELALVAIPPKSFPDLDCYSVTRSPLVLTASAEGPYGDLELKRASTEDLSPADRDLLFVHTLSTVPMIVARLGLSRERLDRWTRERGIKPHIAAETAGNEAILALARLGLGLGLVPRIVLENSPFAQGLVIYQAGAEFGEYDIGFVQRPLAGGSEANRRLRSAMIDLLTRTYPEGTLRSSVRR